jgi:magnesium chelatase subunit I
MNEFQNDIAKRILPYSYVVGETTQDDPIKLALELAYITPLIGGVLLSGHRGTGKSTVVRAFARMMYGELPVTLPINATEDRVVGDWDIEALMYGKARRQAGLLTLAHQKILYVDEVNLLDDHIVNLILDVTSTGILEIQRENWNERQELSFILVGTMNPDEGGLRPQLLDRFGLMVDVVATTSETQRREILKTVLAHDKALFEREQGETDTFLDKGYQQDAQKRETLVEAKKRLYKIDVPEEIVQRCVDLAKAFQAEGYRGDYVLALAARALAARDNHPEVTQTHMTRIARLVLQHRRSDILQGEKITWTETDNNKIKENFPDA